jgi:hypothetical protein
MVVDGSPEQADKARAWLLEATFAPQSGAGGRNSHKWQFRHPPSILPFASSKGFFV